eukprot:CAMPEP_0173407044 /NCGR_PEP_ID=MMETSP1356-20130122/66149_1 /TAXON_ID=77927 ORGANISM="Hemiselmis virescens, Strain PCC157" /NCGR_SAMPLE_ID=MMETSP1356 /ASSEMBLY_ACC=CAM_ASM_000847 /LENGTH=59 /DNA_ID=CAMNT_0014368143 /DNA_START=121 /DNA_END=300 /DNA_ORIENTATION=+
MATVAVTTTTMLARNHTTIALSSGRYDTLKRKRAESPSIACTPTYTVPGRTLSGGTVKT